ncbi:MAG: hypothetical protein ACTSQQ_04565 [Candidatus Helarchaeota archaeon]
MKNVAELKSFLEERINELREEIEALQEELELHKRALNNVDAILAKESFKSAADLIKQPEKPKFKPLAEQTISEEELDRKNFPIKTKTGEVLGHMSVFGNTISIIPQKNLDFSSQARPFRSFFKGKIIRRMETEDEQNIQAGKISESQKISMNVITDEIDNIQNIIILNYGTGDRIEEIKSTITWTFRTIYDELYKLKE